jgi:hypothetical protein
MDANANSSAPPDATPCAKSSTPSSMFSKRAASGDNSPTTCPRGRPSITTIGVGRNGGLCVNCATRWLRGRVGKQDAVNPSRWRWTVRVCRPPQRGARGYDGGKRVKGRKRHLVVDSQGSVLGVWVSPADVSDAQGARVVLEAVLRRYRSVQIVIADGAYDREGLLEWLLGGVLCGVGLCASGGWLWFCGVVASLVGGAEFCVVVGLSSFSSLL